MKCPYCFQPETQVIDSRITPTEDSIRRRRECNACKKRFTTYERSETNDMSVLKKDGSIEQFDKQKVLRGMLKACEKRPIKRDKISLATDAVEAKLLQSGKEEISSRKIGELVAEELKNLDEVAYVRFASVYRRFSDVSQFADEVKKLKGCKK